jgi:hypothetical protein
MDEAAARCSNPAWLAGKRVFKVAGSSAVKVAGSSAVKPRA